MKKPSVPSSEARKPSTPNLNQSSTMHSHPKPFDAHEIYESTTSPNATGTSQNKDKATRTAVVWAALIVGLLLLVLLIIFIAQNQVTVTLEYFGWNGSVGLGLTMFISAVAGGLLVAAVAIARILQLRSIISAQSKRLNHQ